MRQMPAASERNYKPECICNMGRCQQPHRQRHEHRGIRGVRMLVVTELIREAKLVLLLGAVVLHMHAALARLARSKDQESRVPQVGAR